jgi:hypothetical protein
MWQQETYQAFEDYLKERTLLRPGDPSSS